MDFAFNLIDKMLYGGRSDTRMDNLRVSKILIHPIKSCRGISVTNARYSVEGLEYDRRWCIVEAETNAVVTARGYGKTVLITPVIELDPISPHGGELEVSFPRDSGCETFWVPLKPSEEILESWELLENITFSDWSMDGYIGQSIRASPDSPSSTLSKYLGKPMHLVYKGPRPRTCKPTAAFPKLNATFAYQDGYPLTFMSEESVEEVERQVRKYVGVQGVGERWRDGRLVIERFRPNVVVHGGEPFIEDMWEEVKIGSSDHSPTILFVAPCARCLLPNVDTETGERDRAVPYKVLMKFRTGIDTHREKKPCLGCDGVPSGPGLITVGDEIRVEKVKIDR